MNNNTSKGASPKSKPQKPPPQTNEISNEQKQELIDYFLGGSYYQNELLKYIYICIMSTCELARIEKECAELRKIINESKNSFKPDHKRTASRIIDEYFEWRQNNSGNKPGNLLKQIGRLLGISSTDIESNILKNLQKLEVHELSAFRSITFQKFKGMFDFNNGNYSELNLRSKRKEEIAELAKRCKELEEKYENSLKQLETIKNKEQIDMLTAKNNSLKQSFDTMQKQIQEKDREIEKLSIQIKQTSEHKFSEQQATNEKNDESQVKQLSVEDLNKLSKEELIDDIKEYQVKYDSLNQQFDLFHQEVEEKDEEIKRLRKQIKQYQSALGNATNVQHGENDVNNSFQLVKDIEKIQGNVVDAVKIKGKKIVIMNKQADETLSYYHSRIKISDDNGKLALSCALQRFIVSKVFGIVENFTKKIKLAKQHKDEFAEQFIIYYTQELCMLIEKLSTNRIGSDGFTCITPIKIRQQVNAALGARGFHMKKWHPTIRYFGDDIISKLNRCRKLPQEMNEETQERIYELVLELLQLRFRIDTQDPIPEIRWFNAGETIDIGLMQGSDVEDNEEELEVDLCYFPVIGTFLDDPKNRRVYFKAQILTRIKKHDQSDRRNQRGSFLGSLNPFKKH
ncbi:1746_t:CDS:1 [Ambispora leptoticha]|uniref:1746_t:CDS:1 n=1 Tax=Ambispora leptoticha TaxID=144679 RepID=A0A9N9BSD1_9GLOM|nr:1746_t:CDS:1 [Ambispora leptoticha]